MLPRAVRTRLKPLGEFSRWLQRGLQSSQDGSKMAQGASKTPRRLLQDHPRTKTPSGPPPSAPTGPKRLSKSLQDGSGSLQDPSKSSPGEVLESPSRLQELPRRGFGDSKPRPRALPRSRPSPAPSSLWPASGLGGMREALTIRQSWTLGRSCRSIIF